MSKKEVQTRIKVNKLLEETGWRFFDSETWPTNIRRLFMQLCFVCSFLGGV